MLLSMLARMAPASDDLPGAAAAGAATAVGAAGGAHTMITDLDALLHGLIAAAVVKAIQIALSSAIEGLRASINGKGGSDGKA